MKSTKIFTAMLALAVISIGSASAATTGSATVDLSVIDEDPFVARMTQTHNAYSGSDNVLDDGYILSGSDIATASYSFIVFDRNGETKLTSDHLISLEIYEPDATVGTGFGGSQTTTLVDLTAANMTVDASPCGLTADDANDNAFTGDITPGLGTDQPIDGLLHCEFSVTYNLASQSTPAGEYTFKMEILDGAGAPLDVPETHEIVTVVFDYLDISVTTHNVADDAGNGGIINFGTLDSNSASADALQYLKVTNSRSSSFQVSLQIDDLAHIVSAQEGDISASRFSVAEAGDAVVDPDTASFTGYGTGYDGSYLVEETGYATYAFKIIDISNNTNDVLTDGAFTGGITVNVNVDAGGSPYYYDGTNYNADRDGDGGYDGIEGEILFEETLGSPPDGSSPVTIP